PNSRNARSLDAPAWENAPRVSLFGLRPLLRRMPAPMTTTSSTATAPIGMAGASLKSVPNEPNTSPRRFPSGRLACMRTHSSSSKPRRGRVVANASSRRRWRASSSRSSLSSLNGLLLAGDCLAQRLQGAVVEHLGRVLGAAHEMAYLLEAEPGMAQRDRLALA